MTLNRGDRVSHPRYGVGRVELALEDTVIVRFDTVIHEVLRAELTLQSTVLQALQKGEVHHPAETLMRVQAELITSLNDAWGVFSRSRIALLPHQLWVCHQVLSTWPPRWLIADDVGLGKTVEAGLILWPLLSRRTVTRLLIICPASLTEQWQTRMKSMFDIRLTQYAPDLDRPTARAGATYWDIHQQVIASLQTLRDDRKGRHDRLLSADPWDLVIIDEAHHLNVDDATGATLGYRLVERLQEAGKITGLVMFTATPHRGKDHGFLSLLRLVRPDLFALDRPLSSQLSTLPQVVIRNNKQTVTDLQGKRLFQTPNVASEEYTYSPEETDFHKQLTDFIVSGQSYAASLGNTPNGQAVMLVLIALQKLASSSVAAIRRALQGRNARVSARLRSAEEAVRAYQDLINAGDGDTTSAAEEQVGDWSGVMLMLNERARLEELLRLAGRVEHETKIDAVLRAVGDRFHGRSVLFFTEYKATQSLLLSALMERYGPESATFINGDDRADDVLGRTLYASREEAARSFNSGEVRFLVATEAAGEGIDLQHRCHTLIHVDLPWNPMRLHQRVGRLNRYGQEHRVDVLSFRNPGTVEALIWEKLNTKIGRIMDAFQHVMDEPEDLLQLVLGMTSPHLFQEIFSKAGAVPRSNLNDWFDRQTAQFGGRDAVQAVRDLIGHSASFDYQQVSELIPRVDLPDLLPFFRGSLRFNHRRPEEHDDGVSFKTPEVWLNEAGVLRNYHGLNFRREGGDPQRVAGVGHRAVDAALSQARQLKGSVTVAGWSGLIGPLYVFRVSDRVTNVPGARRTFVGRLMGGTPRWLRDWELLQALNVLQPTQEPSREEFTYDRAQLVEVMGGQQAALEGQLGELGLSYEVPLVEPHAVFVPIKYTFGKDGTLL